MDAGAVLLVEYQAVENCQNLFTVAVDPLQRFAEGHLEIGGAEPFIEHVSRHVDILAQVLDSMATEEKSVKKCRLSLRR